MSKKKLDFGFITGEDGKGPEKVLSLEDMDIPPGMIPRAQPLDIEAAKNRFTEYEDKLQKMTIEAQALEVKDDQTATKATEMIAQVKKLYSSLDDQRKWIIKDPDQFVRKLNAFVKVYKDKLSGIERSIKGELGEYTYRLELKRREDEATAAKALEKKQAELDKAAKEARVEPVKLPTQNIPRRPVPIRSSSGTATTVMVPYWEVVDINKVPRQYLMINNTAVDMAMKSGIKNIPGIAFDEKAQIRVRKI